MDVCPLDWRYGSREIREIFDKENVLRTRLNVEVALLKALRDVGLVSEADVNIVEGKIAEVKSSEVEDLESKLGHDVMAMVVTLAQKSGDAGRFVHFGATSYDIVDTANAILFRQALNIIIPKLMKILDILAKYSNKYRDIIMVGRTHGQHALPITLGFKFANYLYEFSRSLERINESKERIIRIKMAGAVGTMAGWGDKGIEIEQYVSKYLGIPAHVISTQVAPRDGFAEIISDLAILTAVGERFSLEVRELMRPEISEIGEGVGERVGSSTMPQKENPVTAEKITGLSRIVRSFVSASIENIPLWHERDLTNSSSERILISHTFIIVDEILNSLIELLTNLRLNINNMEKNLQLTRGQIMAESLMVNLTLRGMARHEAHRLAGEISREVRRSGSSFLDACLKREEVTRLFTEKELKDILDPKNYLGEYSKLIDRSIDYYNRVKQEVKQI
ncbi:adenylosuccinate lyase [Sulfuracidifex tepidarius]|uniref:Adenylosuccinate lyase n=1 Tax=Sulfuracidifex tepidarius TaxID=1294262 RepID=A0A510E5B6_9CREN|nr:adenylosuccinate lyase [Sulfuracidifex tepidarius]BBG24492.1 Fumarate hydratase class II [Sulfuracidifex tepidarius]BBG27250.1 Fumarate hydratase class II [Sulfuracidifex tepidarius]